MLIEGREYRGVWTRYVWMDGVGEGQVLGQETLSRADQS
jgi:hypothetical protein